MAKDRDIPVAYLRKRREDDDDIPFAAEKRKRGRPLHGRPLPPGIKFAPPQVIAELTNAKPSGRGWDGHCPCHDDQHPSLSIGWGRKRNTVVHCHAGCSQDDLTAYFRLKGLSLDPNATERAGADPYLETHPDDAISVLVALEAIETRQNRPPRGAIGPATSYPAKSQAKQPRWAEARMAHSPEGLE